MRWAAVTAGLVLFVSTGPALAQSAADEAAVRALASEWQESWNRRDADALGALLADDVDFTSVLGPAGRGRGRASFVRSHAGMFQTLFVRSVWSTDEVKVDFVRPEVAVAHVYWSTTGDDIAGRPPGAPRRGKFLWVVEKRPEGWRVIAAQNTEAPAAAPQP